MCLGSQSNGVCVAYDGSGAGRDKRPIVEFALESAQAVRKMATKQAWQKSQAQSQPPGQQTTSNHALTLSVSCTRALYKGL